MLSYAKRHHSFREKSKLMNHTLVQNGSKGSEAAVLVVKPRYSAFYNEKAKCILKSFPIVPERLYKPLSEVKWNQIVLYIQIVGAVIMA